MACATPRPARAPFRQRAPTPLSARVRLEGQAALTRHVLAARRDAAAASGPRFAAKQQLPFDLGARPQLERDIKHLARMRIAQAEAAISAAGASALQGVRGGAGRLAPPELQSAISAWHAPQRGITWQPQRQVAHASQLDSFAERLRSHEAFLQSLRQQWAATDALAPGQAAVRQAGTASTAAVSDPQLRAAGRTSSGPPASSALSDPAAAPPPWHRADTLPSFGLAAGRYDAGVPSHTVECEPACHLESQRPWSASLWEDGGRE